MSEENKTVELKDEELEKVSGGSVSEVDNSIIGKWYKKDDSPDLEIYFYPIEILNNQYIYGEKYSYVPSRNSYAGSYANISISEFSSLFNLSGKPGWIK